MCTVKSLTELQQEAASTKIPRERARLLLEISRRSCNSMTNNALECAEEAASLARSSHLPDLLVECGIQLGISLQIADRYEEALKQFRETEKICRDIESPQYSARLCSAMAEPLISLRDLSRALNIIHRGLNTAEKIRAPSLVAELLNKEGIVHRIRGDYSQALDRMLKAIDIATAAADGENLSACYINISITYCRLGDYLKSREFLRKPMDQSCPRTKARALVALGIIALCEGNEAEALESAQQALAYYRDLKDRSGTASALISCGEAEGMCGNWSQAEQYYSEARKILTQIGPPGHYCRLASALGKADLYQGRYRSAIEYLQKAITGARATGERHVELDALSMLSTAHERSGALTKALYYQRLHDRYLNDFLGPASLRAIVAVEINAHKESIRHETRKKEAYLQSLREEIEKREHTISSMALQVLKKTEALSKVGEELRRASESKNGRQWRKIRDYVDRVSGPSNRWDSFIQRFRKVYEGFDAVLVRHYPQLTATELKVCCLIRIGLSSKEIADLLCVAVRTIEIHRGNIRKKLRIPRRQSLPVFIAQIKGGSPGKQI